MRTPMRDTNRAKPRPMPAAPYLRMKCLSMFCLSAALAFPALAAPDATGNEAILQRFADDYRSDPMAVSDTFGVKVDDDWWWVVVEAGTEGPPNAVELHPGPPPEPTWYFHTDAATLERLDAGTLNAGTAMAKAFSTDFAPLDADAMEGFVPDETFMSSLMRAVFHFWTRGFPEVIPFGDEYTRYTHGTDVTIFYYQEGLRSGWFSVKKGQHVNEDPDSRTNPFPSMVIVTSGRGIAHIDGKDVQLEAGESIFIPPGVSHEFWTDDDQPFQGILLMFGEGA